MEGVGRGCRGGRAASILPAALGVLLLTAAACGGTVAAGPDPLQPAPPRGFALGFSDFPYAFTASAVADTTAVLTRDADLVMLHFDDGVPWDEALAGAPYPPAYQADLERKAASLPRGHQVYLAVTPIAFERDRLAARRGDGDDEPLARAWDRLEFDDPQVTAAFLAHCERMIALFRPDYFAYGVEVNLLRQLAPQRWPAFVRLVAQLYPALKQAHPALPVFLTFQADCFHAQRATQTAALTEVLAFSDLVAVSTYPFSDGARVDPTRVRGDHFGALVALGGGRPFAIAETCWPAEPVSAPYPAAIPSDDAAQRAWVERLLQEADALDARFVSWFFTRDYDALWESHLSAQPNAALLRLWKDCGLYAGDARPRPALAAWRAALARPRSR